MSTQISSFSTSRTNTITNAVYTASTSTTLHLTPTTVITEHAIETIRITSYQIHVTGVTSTATSTVTTSAVVSTAKATYTRIVRVVEQDLPEQFISANATSFEKAKERQAAAAAAALAALHLNRNLSNQSVESTEESITSKLNSGYYISLGIGALVISALGAAFMFYLRRPAVAKLIQTPRQIEEQMQDLDFENEIDVEVHEDDEEEA
jgi:hypothetical protein